MSDAEFYERLIERKEQCAACGKHIISMDLYEEASEHTDVDDSEVTTQPKHEHHVSYEPEKVVDVCRRCHYQIHREGKHPELTPDKTPAEMTVEGPAEEMDPAELALALLYLNPESTTSDVGKQVFDPDSKEELRNADRKVRYYFEQKYPHLLETEQSDGRTVYSADPERVFVGLGRVQMATFRGDDVSLGFGVTLLYIDSGESPVLSVVGGLSLDGDTLVDEMYEGPFDPETDPL